MFDTGDTTDTEPKCTAVSGAESAIAPTLLETEPAAKRRKRRTCRCWAMRVASIFRRSARYIRPERSQMPAAEEKLNCRLTLAQADGLRSSRSESAVKSDVAPSLSRPKSGADRRKSCMTAARVTEGVKPVIAAKSSSTGRLTATAHGRRPVSRKRKPMRKAMCMPDTATTCARPASARA